MIKNKNLCINPHHAKCFVTMNMDLINEEDSIEDMTNELNTIKNAKALYSAKAEIKKYCVSLPL